MTLSRLKVEEVRSLLAKGRSHREIAEALDVARTTVWTIASGNHSLDHRGHADHDFGFDDSESLNFARCPTCGGKVLMPCRLCFVRSVMEKHQVQKH